MSEKTNNAFMSSDIAYEGNRFAVTALQEQSESKGIKKRKYTRHKKVSLKTVSKKSLKTAKAPIKRPRNAFIIFSAVQRAALSKSGCRKSDISTTIGKMWQQLDVDKKNEYYKQAKIEEIEHRLKYPDYVYKPEMAMRKEIQSQIRLAQMIEHNTDLILENNQEIGENNLINEEEGENESVSCDSSKSLSVCENLLEEEYAKPLCLAVKESHENNTYSDLKPGTTDDNIFSIKPINFDSIETSNHEYQQTPISIDGPKKQYLAWSQVKCPLCLHYTFSKCLVTPQSIKDSSNQNAIILNNFPSPFTKLHHPFDNANSTTHHIRNLPNTAGNLNTTVQHNHN